MSVFQIFPASVNSIQEELLEDLKDKTDLLKFKRKYKDLKGHLQCEISTNITSYTSYTEQPVSFGSLVQFQHFHSKKFLTVSTEKHEVFRDKFKLELSDFATTRSCFSIDSAYKFQKQNDIFIKPEGKVFIGFYSSELDHVIYVDMINNFNEILGNLENKIALNIFPYNLDPYSEFSLFCGDFLQMVHSENNSCFIGSKNPYETSVVEPKFSKNHLNYNGI